MSANLSGLALAASRPPFTQPLFDAGLGREGAGIDDLPAHHELALVQAVIVHVDVNRAVVTGSGGNLGRRHKDGHECRN